MCGISVLFNPDGSPDLASRLLAMHDVIRHRGPDGEGFLLAERDGAVQRVDNGDQLRVSGAPRLGFAFRRLKICDLSEAADQPMASPDGRYWLVYNGEIYNYLALRRELEQQGRVFRTHGDTEVVLAAYEAWGEESFRRLEGMWAIAILDLRRNRLVLSRDRFGIKPIVWTREADGTLLFASEIKQIVAASPPGALRANRPLVEMFLRGQRSPWTDETFFEGVRVMPPATWCAIDLAAPAAPRFQAYWDLAEFTAEDNRLRYEEALERCEALLADAVSAHCQADVKVGALLSGGLDSATLVALAHRNGAPKLPTYSLGYREAAPEFCELRYVDAMTRRDGIENHETGFDAAWVRDNTDRILWALEEPPLAMPAFAQYRIFELCKAHGATVVLDGQGSDEITAGYPYYQRILLRQRLCRGDVPALLSALGAMARREGRSSAALFYDLFLRSRLARRPVYDWVVDGGRREDDDAFTAARGDLGNDPSPVNRRLYFDVKWGNVKIILGYGDRNAMAHSVESRVPYFDRAFVELLFSLPDEFKLGNGECKHILRDVARRYVTPEITERRDRMGFGTPDETMLRGPLRGIVAEAVNDKSFRASGWIDAPKADDLLQRFEQGREPDHRAVWRLFVLSRWANKFAIGG